MHSAGSTPLEPNGGVVWITETALARVAEGIPLRRGLRPKELRSPSRIRLQPPPLPANGALAGRGFLHSQNKACSRNESSPFRSIIPPSSMRSNTQSDPLGTDRHPPPAKTSKRDPLTPALYWNEVKALHLRTNVACTWTQTAPWKFCAKLRHSLKNISRPRQNCHRS